jgi:hypothetical protein
LSDHACGHCTDGPRPNDRLGPCSEAWVHEDCSGEWSEARQAQAMVDDHGAKLDWTPRFSADSRCVVCWACSAVWR